MRHADVTLDDKFMLPKGRAFITGVQALLRVLLDQRRLDERAGLNTAGFLSGYRGSPLGGLDQQARRAQKHLDQAHVVFKEGLQSVYNKAKAMHIPVVNLLWIEDCKKYNKVVDSSKYKINDLERYENPDLYKKIRRQKSMQPDYQFDYASNKLVYKSDKRASIGKYKPTPQPVFKATSEESLDNLVSDNEKPPLVTASDVSITSDVDKEVTSHSSVCDSMDEYVKVSS